MTFISVLAGNFSKCEKMNSLRLGDDASDDTEGPFKFECNADGSFKKRQCDGFLNECWCVNQFGSTVDGTVTNGGEPDCTPSKYCSFT